MLQESEARLPLLLKTMLWAQSQLDEKLSYPKVADIATGRLAPPGTPGHT